MFKVIVAAAAVVFAASMVVPVAAEAAEKRRVVKSKVAKAGGYRVARRPASVGPNGLCQRDTGTPESQLDFRNKCDVEEYWARTMERGTDADR